MMRNNNNQVMDLLNPYYVHPSKNSSTICVTPALSGDNYHAWSMKVIRALEMKNKIQFLDGKIKIPHKSDLNYVAW